MKIEQNFETTLLENKDAFRAEAFFLDLSKKMHDRTFLTENPVLKPEISHNSLEKIVGEYSGLVSSIVGFLGKARYRLKGYQDIASELDRNISEERGSRTQGVSHQALFTACVLKEKGISLSEMPWSDLTLDFLNSIDAVLSKGSRSQVAGAIYALEATATPELHVVAKLLAKIPSIESATDSKTSLDSFIAMHIDDFEPGHRDRLAEVFKKYLENNTFNPRQFERAFEMILDAMNVWWTRLATV